MPFFVYGTNAESGEVAKRFYSAATTEADARRHAEEHGMQVSNVVACSEAQRPPELSADALRARQNAPRLKPTITPADIKGAAARAAHRNAESDAASAETRQLRVEMAEFVRELAEYTPRVYVTYSLIAVNVLVFVLMALSGVNLFKPSVADLLRWGAEYGPYTSDGQWWRLLAAVFVHIGLTHLVFNMLSLAYVGPTVERLFGNLGFLLVYLVSGLGASLWALYQNPVLVHAGASGAIFGMYGALLATVLKTRESIPGHVAARLKKFASIFILYNLAYSFAPGISLAAHFGGLVVGFGCGWLMAQRLEGRATIDGRFARNACVAAVGAVIVAVGVYGVRAGYPNLERVQQVLTRYDGVEAQARKTFAAAAEQARKAELSNQQFADVIERDVLPSWRDTRTEVASLARIPSPVIARVIDYMQMRQVELESLDQALHSNDAAAIKQAMEKGERSSQRLSGWANKT